MGIIQKDAFRTMLISYLGLGLGYLNKGVLFLLILSTEQIGLVNLLISVGLLFAQFSNLGTVNTLLRFFPYFRSEEKNHYGFLKLTLMIAFIGILLTSFVSIFFYDEITYYYHSKSPLFVVYYFWIIPVGISNLLFFLLETYLKGLFDNIVAVFAKEIILRLLQTILLFLYWFDLMNFNQFVIGSCLIYFIPVFILVARLISLNELKGAVSSIQVPRRFRKIIVGYSLYNYANTLGAVFVITMDTMMIAALLGLKATGIYTTILYLTSALQVPYRSLMRVAVPFVPLYWRERKLKEMNQLYKDVSSASLIMSVLMFLLVWVNREELFGFLPPDFNEGIGVFLFIMIGRVVDMYFGINGNILMNSKKYQIDILFTVILLATVFVLNIVLIPVMGINGAALSTMVGLVTYNLLRLFFVWYHYGLHPFLRTNLIVFLFTGLVLILTELTPAVTDNVYLSICFKTILIGVLFILPVYLLKVDKKINDYVNKILARIRSIVS